MNDTLGIVLAAAVVAFLFFKYRSSSAAEPLGAPPRPGGASGSPQDSDALEHSIGAAVGAGGCAAGAAALGAPQLGGALAPACAALGSFVAPYVEKGAVFAAKKTAAGAVFLASKSVEGAKWGMNQGQAALSDPLGTAFVKPTQLATKVAGTSAGLVDRFSSSLFHKAPAPVQLALAPVYVTTKVTARAVAIAAAGAGKVTGALSSGVKSATNAVSSGVHKVLGFL